MTHCTGHPPAARDPAQAHAGDSITIIGERFDGRSPAGNVVTFTKIGGGQTIAVVSAASRTQLTVTVPSDAATGPLSVQTQGGTAASAANFVVLPPAPVISDFSPTHGAIGSSVTLTGSNLQVAGGPTSVTFAGSGGNRLSALVTSLSATQAVVTVPNAAVTGPIELTTAGGTAATAQPFTVEVDAAIPGEAVSEENKPITRQSFCALLSSIYATSTKPHPGSRYQLAL